MNKAEFSTLRGKFRRLKAQKGVCVCPSCAQRAMQAHVQRHLRWADESKDEHRIKSEEEAGTTVVFKSPVNGAQSVNYGPGAKKPVVGGGGTVH